MWLVLVLAGCDREEKDSNTTYVPLEQDDSGANTDDSQPVDPNYLEVAALGFEYKGGWDEENQLLENFLYTDSNGDAQASSPYILITLATIDYFSMTSDDPGFEDEYCEFIAFFYYAPASFQGTEFDYDAGKGGTGVELETWGSFEGYLEVLPDSYSDRCYELDPEVFAGGDPLETLDGMHFGLGFGPLSDYLYETYSASESFAEYEDAYMSQYIAINHPDGAGGYTFDAYDWNGSLLIQTDYDYCITIESESGDFDVCGLPEVTEDNYYVPDDATIRPSHGYVTGFSWWLEDTPNLDLSILKEGI